MSHIASVASFFVSRIDTLVDSLIAEKLKTATDAGKKRCSKASRAKSPSPTPKSPTRDINRSFAARAGRRSPAKGAQTQRVLWASTSTKNPRYRDVLYVEELIGARYRQHHSPGDFDAFRDHGKLRPSLTEDVDQAAQAMADLEKAGISMKEVTDKLLVDGVKIFAEAFDKLLEATGKPRRARVSLNRQSIQTAAELSGGRAAAPSTIGRRATRSRRLWPRDATLWTGTDENKWLGWLGVAEEQLAHIAALQEIADEVRGRLHARSAPRHGRLQPLSRGLSKTFGKLAGFPELHVLDSTDPAQIAPFEKKIDLTKTVFIVSSKSGSTLEPNIFKPYSSNA